MSKKERRLKLVTEELPPIDWKSLWFLLALAALVYIRCVAMPYVRWDDDAMVLENGILRMPLGQALQTSFTRFYHGDYMPVTLLSFWLDFKLFGENAAAQHAVNFVFHLANVVLLYVVLSRFRLREYVALFITALFALHPVQAESVFWVSERKGLISTFFLLWAILLSERSIEDTQRSLRWQILYGLSYLTSFLAKATGVLLPIWLIVWDRFNHRLPWKRVFLRHGPVLFVGAVATWGRIEAYKASVPSLLDAALNMERLMMWPAMALSGIGFYLKIFLWPQGLSIIYPNYFVGDWSISFLLVVAAVISLTGLGLKFKNPWYAMWGLWVVLFLLPVLQIIPRINFVNDRYLYLPLIGLAGITVELLWDFKNHRFMRYALGAVVVLLALLTFKQGDIWSANDKLWEDTVLKNPRNGLARNNWAQELQRKGQLGAAVEQFQKTLEFGQQDGTDNLAYNNLAVVYSSPESGPLFDLNKARSYLLEGIRRSSRPDEAYTLRFNLATLYIQQNDLMSATRELQSLEKDIAESRNERYAFLLERVRILLAKLRTQ